MADDSSEIVKEQSESVAAANLKVVGDGPAFYSNLAMGNAVAHQQAMQQLQMSVAAKASELIMATSPAEGGSDIAALAQLLKGVVLAPPQSPVPSA